MLSQEIEEKLADRLVKRIQETNTRILQEIGEAIKYMSNLTPSQAYKIQQILRFGGSYEKIARELAKVSGKNVEDIYKIFEEVAKSNKDFAKQFYKYRGIDFVPYSKDSALKQMVNAISRQTAETYMNIANTKGIGFIFEDLRGQRYFKNIQQSYYEIIDRGILAISQGKETFQTEMRRIMKQMGNSGLVLYESGRTRRLDGAVRMNILDGIRQLNIETSIRFAEEYQADGIEISVHTNPAPDHSDIQGRQFSIEEYEKLENGEIATDLKGNKYDGADKRRISEYNCYHKIFPIVLGVSKPEYTDEQLKEIQEKNENGFEFESKHYTMYERNAVTEANRTQYKETKRYKYIGKSKWRR